jgi:putative flippase GtrA
MKIRYLITGIINTLVGYLIGNALYYLTPLGFSVIIVGIVSSYISISFSYLTFKIFVFRTKGKWLIEYIKCFFVYGFSSAIGIALIACLVNIFNVEFWISQAITIIVMTLTTFIGHRKLTFNNR